MRGVKSLVLRKDKSKEGEERLVSLFKLGEVLDGARPNML